MQTENAYYMFRTQKYFYLKTIAKVFGHKITLRINRESGKVTQAQEMQINQKLDSIINFSLVLGIIIIKAQPFLLLVTQSKLVCKLFNHQIRIINAIQFVPFSSKFNKKSENYDLVIEYMNCIKEEIFKDNFYFSFTMDLTLNQQNASKGVSSEDMFFWNSFMLKSFIDPSPNFKYFTIPVIQGFIQKHQFQNFQYLIISRRSKYMSGTRFNCRGIDDEGHVANFVQTQQILLNKSNLASYVQLRGSIPIYWKQNSKTLGVSIQNSSKSEKIISKHYQIIQKIYGYSITLNLLGKKKTRESDLTQVFRTFFTKLNLQKHLYQHFDIHDYLKNKIDIQKSLDNYLEKQKDKFLQDHFLMHLTKKEAIRYQKKFNRINCLDCQDRTNALMSKISFKMLIRMMATLQIKKQYISRFQNIHKKVWVKNGEKISMIYSGTGSVATYITEGQKSTSWTQSISNLFIEAKRMYVANVNDSHKQQCINIVLGLGFESVTDYFQTQQSSSSSIGKVSNFEFE